MSVKLIKSGDDGAPPTSPEEKTRRIDIDRKKRKDAVDAGLGAGMFISGVVTNMTLFWRAMILASSGQAQQLNQRSDLTDFVVYVASAEALVGLILLRKEIYAGICHALSSGRAHEVDE